MTYQYDLSIVYRIYPKVSKVPPIFSDDKYKLSEICVKSFRESLQGLKFKMLVLLDDCPEEYHELFTRYFEPDEIELKPLAGIGNKPTFKMQMDYLLEQKYSENIYFAEDDYFYLPNTFWEMLYALKSRDVDFVSPYDHLDYYNHPLHEYSSEIRVFQNRHWRTAASTTLTFLTTKNTLRQSKHIFESYLNNNLDSSLWLTATKFQIRNPFKVVKIILNGSGLHKNLLKSWFNSAGWKQILFGKRYKLWVPTPSIATHMEGKFLAPTLNWERCFKEAVRSDKSSL